MTFDFTLYSSTVETPLCFTIEATSEVDARKELRARLAAVGIGALESADWRVAVTVVRKARP